MYRVWKSVTSLFSFWKLDGNKNWIHRFALSSTFLTLNHLGLLLQCAVWLTWPGVGSEILTSGWCWCLSLVNHTLSCGTRDPASSELFPTPAAVTTWHTLRLTQMIPVQINKRTAQFLQPIMDQSKIREVKSIFGVHYFLLHLYSYHIPNLLGVIYSFHVSDPQGKCSSSQGEMHLTDELIYTNALDRALAKVYDFFSADLNGWFWI